MVPIFAGNASSGFKVQRQENICSDVLLVSPPQVLTSVEDNKKMRLSDEQQNVCCVARMWLYVYVNSIITHQDLLNAHSGSSLKIMPGTTIGVTIFSTN